jgi:hypothetical protein
MKIQENNKHFCVAETTLFKLRTKRAYIRVYIKGILLFNSYPPKIIGAHSYVLELLPKAW